jgi:hypothetical protein
VVIVVRMQRDTRSPVTPISSLRSPIQAVPLLCRISLFQACCSLHSWATVFLSEMFMNIKQTTTTAVSEDTNYHGLCHICVTYLQKIKVNPWSWKPRYEDVWLEPRAFVTSAADRDDSQLCLWDIPPVPTKYETLRTVEFWTNGKEKSLPLFGIKPQYLQSKAIHPTNWNIVYRIV